MKIVSVSIKNFRGYGEETEVEIGDMTTFVGKNDAGKSTILDALDIFFGEGKIDKDDVNKNMKAAGDVETVLKVRFADLPEHVNIDAGNETTLHDEYLLNDRGELEVVKKYLDGGKAKISILCQHPQNVCCNELLLKKNSDLKNEIEQLGLDCDKTRNAVMRHAIWRHYQNELQIGNVEIDAEPKIGDMKVLWANLQTYMPIFSLFKADRSNDDKDPEVQDPMKLALKEIFRDSANTELRNSMDQISQVVTAKLREIANQTLSKLREMNPEVANSLNPMFPPAKWEDLFKGVSISGDEDIPMCKRGSGVKRLILMNFFRAEAERRQGESHSPNIVYAIEEPETSQHIDFQRKLINALKTLSSNRTVQVILTTHSASIVKSLCPEDLRLVCHENGNTKIVDLPRYVLPQTSLNEVSYVAFGKEASVEYHNELYGFLQSIACKEDTSCFREEDFEKWLTRSGIIKNTTWIRLNRNGTACPAYPCTLPTRIRNFIHHPENHENHPSYTNDDLVASIEQMRSVILNHIAVVG